MKRIGMKRIGVNVLSYCFSHYLSMHKIANTENQL